ncbi:Uncharacterised protein [Salmonella enterica subsp. enterica serovar Sanjuan]|uniref:Uncharacterized protein n=1 Tax=Salmonella enterica subsp. enterica serovar Sanjuan TaxID=1160765 RepID=A0A3S4IQ03_SALET|nr:Uncharacterised protein [Salmonella enterica subsp. enterica serovar Sanjuan]
MCVGGKLLGPSLGLAPSGLAQALFKTVNHFILNSNYLGDMPGGINHNQYHQMLFNHIGQVFFHYLIV